MRQKRKMIFAVMLVIALVGVMILAGCKGDDNGADEPELKVLTVALNSAPPTIDPHNHRSRISQTITRNWTEALTQQLSDGAHVLDVAESITMVDPVTYDVKIRQGITFHNGEPLTVEDVIFSANRVAGVEGMEGVTSPRRPLAGNVVSLEKIDDSTMRVKMEKPNILVQARNWYHWEIIPKKYFEEVGPEGFAEHPIGIGPFKWVEGDAVNQIVLERYENYYGGAPQLGPEMDRVPALDRVIIKYIPEDTTRVAALLAGEVDIIQGVPVDSIKLLESNPNVKVVSTEGTNWVLMSFNTKKAPFDDIRVRQAIGYAVNYDLLVDQLLGGYADAMYGKPCFMPYAGEPGAPAVEATESPYHYNPEKAKALLEEAGAIGTTFVIDTYPLYSEQAQAVSQMLNEVGLNCSVRVWDPAVITAEVKKGERSVYFFQLGMGRRAPEGIRSAVGTDELNNFTGWSNPAFDELIAKAATITEDTPERNGYYIEAYKIAMEELPALVIHSPRVVEACRANVLNFYPHGGGRVNLHRVDIDVK